MAVEKINKVTALKRARVYEEDILQKLSQNHAYVSVDQYIKKFSSKKRREFLGLMKWFSRLQIYYQKTGKQTHLILVKTDYLYI